jgi:hypothetical protein
MDSCSWRQNRRAILISSTVVRKVLELAESLSIYALFKSLDLISHRADYGQKYQSHLPDISTQEGALQSLYLLYSGPSQIVQAFGL